MFTGRTSKLKKKRRRLPSPSNDNNKLEIAVTDKKDDNLQKRSNCILYKFDHVPSKKDPKSTNKKIVLESLINDQLDRHSHAEELKQKNDTKSIYENLHIHKKRNRIQQSKKNCKENDELVLSSERLENIENNTISLCDKAKGTKNRQWEKTPHFDNSMHLQKRQNRRERDPLFILGLNPKTMNSIWENLNSDRQKKKEKIFTSMPKDLFNKNAEGGDEEIPYIYDQNSYPSHESPKLFGKKKIFHEILGDVFLPISSRMGMSSESLIHSKNEKHEESLFHSNLGAPWEMQSMIFPKLNSNQNNHNTNTITDQHTYSRRYLIGDGTLVPLSTLFFPSLKEESDRSCGFSKGKLRIVSEHGATIRQTFEIDESEILPPLGHLKQNTIIEYVEEKWLPPPPVETCGQYLGEVCIKIRRYKIILEEEDKNVFKDANEIHELSPKAGRTGLQFGWISDRSRLKSDPYIISEKLS